MSGILCMQMGGGVTELELNLSNTSNPNVQTRLTSAGWDGFSPVRLIVDAGAMLNTLTIPTISFANGLFLFVGSGALIGGVRGSVGSPGGYAIYTRVPMIIENHGSIKGGGGGGGKGGGATVNRFGTSRTAYGGDGAPGQGFISTATLEIASAVYGYAGGEVTNSTPPGPGDWIAGDSGSATAYGGRGGNGGPWRSPGSSGHNGAYTGSYSSASSTNGSPGTAAGLNVNGVEFVTWALRGDA